MGKNLAFHLTRQTGVFSSLPYGADIRHIRPSMSTRYSLREQKPHLRHRAPDMAAFHCPNRTQAPRNPKKLLQGEEVVAGDSIRRE